MKEMFYGAKSFTGIPADVSAWRTHALKDINGIFYMTPYRGSLYWDMSRVTDMSYAFYASDFSGNGVHAWNVSQVKTFEFTCK